MYDSLFQEIEREFDWWVTTSDRTAIGRLKKMLAELKAKVNAPIETKAFSQVITVGDVPVEAEAKKDRFAAERAAKAEKAKAKAEPATE